VEALPAKTEHEVLPSPVRIDLGPDSYRPELLDGALRSEVEGVNAEHDRVD
jgi:hypothetical protein